MFTKKLKEKTELEHRIEDAISALAGTEEGSEEYHQIVEDLKVLNDILKDQKKKLDPNVILNVLGNFGLGLIVVLVEIFGHTITSKAWIGVGRNKGA